MVSLDVLPPDAHSLSIDAVVAHDGLDTPIRCGAGLIVVCFTNRSGSTAVCSALSALGLAGPPGRHHNYEFLNDDSVLPEWESGRVSTFEGYLEWVMAAHAGEHGYVTTKASPRQVNHLIEHGVWERFDRRPIVLLVRRRNVLRQAVSLWTAMQDGRWTSLHRGRVGAPDPQFDADAILAIARDLAVENAYAELIADVHDLAVTTLWFEDVVEDPEALMAALRSVPGLPATRTGQTLLPVSRQPVGEKDDWEQRLRRPLF